MRNRNPKYDKKKSYNNNKGKFDKTESRTKRNEDDTDTYVPFKSKTNDWRWYAANEQILKDVASYPFGYPLGNPINYGPAGLDANKWAVPGICTIETLGIPGYADDVNDPINVAARNAFSFIRHANSGSSLYDSPDLMLYFLAMDNIYSFISYCKRIYGIAVTANPTNRYYPKAMVEALGVDFEDIVANLADYRAWLNMVIVKAGSLCVPANMPFMAKHWWMYSGVYLDRPIDKAQTYMYVPHGYFYYALDSSGAGMLKFDILWNHYSNNPTDRLKFADLQTIMNNMLDPVLSGAGAQDFNIMSGDILKAYGPGGVMKLEVVPTGYTVLPAYDETVLDQIQNLTLMGTLYATTSSQQPTGAISDIMQDSTKTYLKYMPVFKNKVPWFTNPTRPSTVTTVAGDNCFVTKRVLTFDRDGVGPEQVMEATRLCNIAKSISYIPGKYEQAIISDTLGSDVACRANIFRYEIDSNGVLANNLIRSFNQSWTFLNIVSNISTTSLSTIVTDIQDMYDNMHRLQTELSYFHRHMPVAITAGIVDEATGTWYFDSFNGYAVDINNYTVIDHDDLKMMSEAALISEFAVTQFGRAAEK